MPTYAFRCDGACDGFDERHPMQTVPDAAECPQCGRSARRVITGAAFGLGRSAGMRLYDATASTADRPDTVTSLPTAGRTRRPTPVSNDPRHARLPRP